MRRRRACSQRRRVQTVVLEVNAHVGGAPREVHEKAEAEEAEAEEAEAE